MFDFEAMRKSEIKRLGMLINWHFPFLRVTKKGNLTKGCESALKNFIKQETGSLKKNIFLSVHKLKRLDIKIKQ